MEQDAQTMKVTSLSTKNVKGKDVQETLTGREIYLGPNGSGKTTRLNILNLLLQGFISSLGKSNEACLEIASGDFLSVSGSLEGGFSFGRKYRRKVTNHTDGSKTFSCTADYTVFPDEGETKAKERLDRITKAVGAFPVMFDINEFLGMSDAAKRTFIFDLSSPEKLGWDKAKVLAAIAEEHRKWVDGWWMPEDSVAENLASMIKHFGTEIRSKHAQIKAQGKMRDELAKERQSAMQEEQGEVGEIESELERLRGDRAEHNKTIAEADAAKASREQLRKQIESTQTRRAEISESKLPDQDEWDETHRKAQEILDANQRNHDEQNARAEELAAELERRTKDREEANASWREKASEGGRCETDAKVIEEKVIPIITDILDEGEDRDSIIKRLTDHQEKLMKRHAEIAAEATEREETADRMRQALAEVTTDLGIAKDKTRDHRHQVQRIEADMNKATYERQAAIEAEASRVAEIERLTQQETELTASLKELPAPPSTDMVEGLIRSLDAQIGTCEDRLKKAVRTRELMNQFDKAVAMIQDDEEEMEKSVAMLEALGAKGLQREIMSQVMDPIQTTVNGLLSNVQDANGDPYESQFNLIDHNGKEVFEIHRLVGGTRIPYNALAGGEKILFGVALVISLILLKDPPVKALCIEAAELDSDNFFKLIGALNTIAGDIDNIMVASCSDHACAVVKEGNSDEVKDWNTVQL
jgi:exonuclease SbcC